MQKNGSSSRITVDTKNFLIIPSFFLYLHATEHMFSSILLSNKKLLKFVAYIPSNFILSLFWLLFIYYLHFLKKF